MRKIFTFLGEKGEKVGLEKNAKTLRKLHFPPFFRVPLSQLLPPLGGHCGR